MAWLNRRALMTLVLCGSGTTLTAVSWLRKPPSYPAAAPAVATPVVAPAPASAETTLGNLDAIAVTAPPRALPPFGFEDADGRIHDLAELRGRPVVLNLWATWCQPCIAELPALARLAREQGPDGIAVVALSTDRGGARQVAPFLADHQIDLPVRIDTRHAAADVFAARGLPTTILIDRDGRERARFEGAADWASAAAQATIRRLTA